MGDCQGGRGQVTQEDRRFSLPLVGTSLWVLLKAAPTVFKPNQTKSQERTALKEP